MAGGGAHQAPPLTAGVGVNHVAPDTLPRSPASKSLLLLMPETIIKHGVGAQIQVNRGLQERRVSVSEQRR